MAASLGKCPGRIFWRNSPPDPAWKASVFSEQFQSQGRAKFKDSSGLKTRTLRRNYVQAILFQHLQQEKLGVLPQLIDIKPKQRSKQNILIDQNCVWFSCGSWTCRQVRELPHLRTAGVQPSHPRVPGDIRRSNPYLWSTPSATFSKAFTEPLFPCHQHRKPKLLPDWTALYYFTTQNALAFVMRPSSVSLWLSARIYRDSLQNHRSRKEGWYYIQAVEGQPVALFRELK